MESGRRGFFGMLLGGAAVGAMAKGAAVSWEPCATVTRERAQEIADIERAGSIYYINACSSDVVIHNSLIPTWINRGG